MSIIREKKEIPSDELVMVMGEVEEGDHQMAHEVLPIVKGPDVVPRQSLVMEVAAGLSGGGFIVRGFRK